MRGRVERVERLLGEWGGDGGVGIALLELLACLLHLILRVAERGLDLRRDERVTTGRGSDLLLDRVGAFFDGRLACPCRRARLPISQGVGDVLLPLRQRRRFGQRAIQRVHRLLSPGGRE